MSRIFFAYFFLFSTILFAEFGVLIHQLPKSSFLLFGAGKSRISANALCDLMHGILSGVQLETWQSEKKHHRSKSSESCFGGILQNSFPNSLFKELVSKHYGLDRKFSRNSMAKPSIRRFCNVQPSDWAGSTRHSGNWADWAGSTRHSGSRAREPVQHSDNR